jgi:hypothetical protein
VLGSRPQWAVSPVFGPRHHGGLAVFSTDRPLSGSRPFSGVDSDYLRVLRSEVRAGRPLRESGRWSIDFSIFLRRLRVRHRQDRGQRIGLRFSFAFRCSRRSSSSPRSSSLHHIGVMQLVIRVAAFVMSIHGRGGAGPQRRCQHLHGTTEAPSPSALPSALTRSELMTVMTSGMATFPGASWARTSPTGSKRSTS